MEPIATKTKIALWCVIGEKEKIDFSLCDFAPDQVAMLDRIVRTKDEKVLLRLEPEQKKLQIAPIESAVRIVSLACRSGGQKIKISDFKSSDNRAESLKRMTGAETPLMLTITAINGHLPFPEAAGEGEGQSSGELVGRTHFLKLQGLRKCAASVRAEKHKGQWHGSFTASMGNYEIASEIASEGGEILADTRAMALEAARARMIDWLESLTIATKAGRQRREKMEQKINAEMGNVIAGAKRANDADENETA